MQLPVEVVFRNVKRSSLAEKAVRERARKLKTFVTISSIAALQWRCLISIIIKAIDSR